MTDTANTTHAGTVVDDDRVTLVVTPRDRFGLAVESLESIVAETDGRYRLIYVDGGSPRRIADRIAAICRDHGFQYLRHDHFLSPNAARNIGWRAAETPYIVFVDNDVIVSSGWLTALVACADETEAAVVTPLTCQREPLHTEIHHAGGLYADDVPSFFARPPEDRRIQEEHVKQGRKVHEVALQREETQFCEFHCALVRRGVLEDQGGLDEALLATKEHIDFSMTVYLNGGRVMFEPRSVVTYLFPTRARSVALTDWPYFVLRWSHQWQKRSLAHFQNKWQLQADPYFKDRNKMLFWRHGEAIAKPVVRRIPLLGRSRFVQRYGTAVLARVLKLWGTMLVAGHDRRTARQG